LDFKRGWLGNPQNCRLSKLSSWEDYQTKWWISQHATFDYQQVTIVETIQHSD
jgi:hypothetical protein